MSQPRVSVIVVSHGRPDLLCRSALSAFHQNQRPAELIRPPFCSIPAIQFCVPRYIRPKLKRPMPRPIGATMLILDLVLGLGRLAFCAACQQGVQCHWIRICTQFFAKFRIPQCARHARQRLEVIHARIGRRK